MIALLDMTVLGLADGVGAGDGDVDPVGAVECGDAHDAASSGETGGCSNRVGACDRATGARLRRAPVSAGAAAKKTLRAPGAVSLIEARPQRKFRSHEGSTVSQTEDEMLVLKYLLVLAGIGLFGSGSALVIYDVYVAAQLRRLLRREAAAKATAAGETEAVTATSFLDEVESRPLRPVRWALARQLAVVAVVPLLLALSIVVVPDGSAGVRISQIWGARPGTLYPGVHIVTPLIDSVVLYDTREQVYTTLAAEPATITDATTLPDGLKAPSTVTTSAPTSTHPSSVQATGEVLTVQAREGLNIGLAVSVRYRLDPQRLSYIHANLPQEVGEEVVAPTVATVYRQLAPNYVTKEIFATKRGRTADHGVDRHYIAARFRRHHRARSLAARS